MSGAGNYCRTDSAVPNLQQGQVRAAARVWGSGGGGGGGGGGRGGGDTIGGGGGGGWWPRTREHI